MSESRLAWLFHCYFDATATGPEIDELMELLRQARNDEQVQRLIASAWNRLEVDRHFFTQEQSDKILRNILHGELPYAGPKLRSSRVRVLRTAALAAIIFLFAVPIYLLLKQDPPKKPVSIKRQSLPAVPDISPGTNKAILTLADGSRITLDSLQNGNLARQGNAKITKSNGGQLVYNEVDKNPSALIYNSISTPVGGQYQLLLSDGTKVWLNAASSLRFPTTFDGKERNVEITGEAYFEIKKNRAMPFRVKVADAVVEVLGTNFNIMAYNNESAIKATLLEGGIKISKGNKSSLLQPGQEAALDPATSTILVKEVDADEAIAWKNGLFEFNSADIGAIMRQLGRWYDVETRYETKIPTGHYTGTIARNIPLSQVLKMLEINGLHFRIEGKKLIVL